MPVNEKEPTPERRNHGWKPVVFTHDCEPCDCCEEPICPHCDIHYADCPCPGPMQEDEFEYKTINGYEYAKEIANNE